MGLLCIFARPPVPRAHDALTLFRGSHLAHVLSAAANGHQRGMSLGASPRPGYAAPPAPETPRRRPSESCVCVRTRSTAPLPHCPSVCTRAMGQCGIRMPAAPTVQACELTQAGPRPMASPGPSCNPVPVHLPSAGSETAEGEDILAGPDPQGAQGRDPVLQGVRKCSAQRLHDGGATCLESVRITCVTDQARMHRSQPPLRTKPAIHIPVVLGVCTSQSHRLQGPSRT